MIRPQILPGPVYDTAQTDQDAERSCVFIPPVATLTPVSVSSQLGHSPCVGDESEHIRRDRNESPLSMNKPPQVCGQVFSCHHASGPYPPPTTTTTRRSSADPPPILRWCFLKKRKNQQPLTFFQKRKSQSAETGGKEGEVEVDSRFLGVFSD